MNKAQLNQYGFSTINRIIEISDKLEQIRTGYNGFNIMELADWLQHEAQELKPLAEDTRNYMEELIMPDYPDQQQILNYEHKQAIEKGVA